MYMYLAFYDSSLPNTKLNEHLATMMFGTMMVDLQISTSVLRNLCIKDNFSWSHDFRNREVPLYIPENGLPAKHYLPVICKVIQCGVIQCQVNTKLNFMKIRNQQQSRVICTCTWLQ